MTTIDTLQAWRDAGWLRPLDLAFARFLAELQPDAPPALLRAAALLAHAEGQGHSALPLQGDTAALLGWPPEAAAALAAAGPLAWGASPLVEDDPAGDAGTTPLVRQFGLLYLRRHWRHEARIAAQVRARAEQLPPEMGAADEQAALDALFGPEDPAAPDRQRLAAATALRGRLTLVTGGPGTGKTWTAARLLRLLQARAGVQPLRVALAAPTGKAAARLRQSITQALPAGGPELPPARTLHALLGTVPGTRRFRHDAAHPLALDLLFVDEASMVHLELMDALLDALPPDARLVLLGDRDQLASVEAGAVMGDLCAAPALAARTVVLTKSRRFDGPIGQLALAVNAGDAAAAQALLAADTGGALHGATLRDPAALLPLALQGHAGYVQALDARPAAAGEFEAWVRELLARFDGFRVLCALREGPWGVAGLNAAVTQALGWRGEWYEGRPVMVTRNDPAAGVFNGDVGLVLRAPDGALRAWFAEGDALRSVAVGRLPDVETAWATTVHKSQGSEFGHVLLVLPDADGPLLTRELLYTGITRARQRLTLAAASPALLAAACARRTRRVSGLAERCA